jgi:hypothetical protein
MNLYILKTPSFYAHIISGFLLLFSFVFIIRNRKIFYNLDVYKFTIIILLLSIALGLHGLSHLGLENIYDFNPLLKK